jgi:pimeloyl-ACP methyl ester carboxylesterase
MITARRWGEMRVSSEFVVDVAGGQLVGSLAGDGPPVLILHGGPGRDYTATLADLLPQWRTIRYQQRGFAPSTTAGPFSIEAHVRDVVAVLDAVGLEQALVIGHSWGGHLAMHLAVAHPDRVLGLVVVDILGAVPDGGAGDLERNLLDRVAASDPEAAAQVKRIMTDDDASAEDARRMADLIWPYYFADPAAAPPSMVSEQNPELSAGVFMSIEEHFERGTLEQGLPGFAGPFHVMHGDQDPLPADAGRRTAALVPGATFALIPNCGHFPWLEQPDAFLAALLPALEPYR